MPSEDTSDDVVNIGVVLGGGAIAVAVDWISVPDGARELGNGEVWALMGTINDEEAEAGAVDAEEVA